MTKYELSIATSYVPNWGIVEAFRELFQNALDNEIENPENRMGCIYDAEAKTVSITNRTSSLSADSLLLGASTKSNNPNTIGQHGEGYKIAFMVLLRNNKYIKVQNYGAHELWNVRLVNSKKYNNQKVTTIFVDRAHIWKKVPNNNLTITVSGVTPEEYAQVVEKNLHLRAEPLDLIKTSKGRIIKTETEKGNIYVKGLFVANKPEFEFGYDFEPGIIQLDRDRRILDSTRLSFETSALWAEAAKQNGSNEKIMLKLFNQSKMDTKYITYSFTPNYNEASNMIVNNFIKENGPDAVPVTNNIDYKAVEDSGKKPVIVSEDVAKAVEQSDYSETIIIEKKKSLKELFTEFMGEIEDRLTDEQLEYMGMLIDKIKN